MRAEDLAEELAIAEERLREDTHVVTRVFQQALSDVTTWPPAITVQSETTVAEAMRIMVEAQVGSVLIVDHGRLVGIFTERDVLTKVATQAMDAAQTPVSACMTQEPLVLRLDDACAYALQAMSLGGYRHVPLLDHEGQPVALVSLRMLVEVLIAACPQQLINLPPSPAHGRPQTVDGA